MDLKKILDCAMSVAIIAACTVIVVFGVIQFFNRQPATVLKVGDKVRLTGVPVGNKTLVAVVSQGCQYCEKSYPFYRILQEKGDLRLLTRKEPLSFYYERGFAKSTVYLFDTNKLNVVGTPTLFLLDLSGKVQKVWRGFLTPEQEKEVFATINE